VGRTYSISLAPSQESGYFILDGVFLVLCSKHRCFTTVILHILSLCGSVFMSSLIQYGLVLRGLICLLQPGVTFVVMEKREPYLQDITMTSTS